jgi:hypothetical protein
MRDTYGRSSPRQFAEYDPDTSCWRTYPATGLWGSTSFSATWPRCGMTCGGRAYELPTWAHPTDGSGCSSLLPTPVADHSRGLPQPGTDYASLPNAVIGLLPTPRQAGDRTSRSAATRRDSMSAPSLGQAVEIAQGQLPREFTTWEDLPPSWQLLPTPTAMDAKASGGSTPSDVTLTDAVVRTQLGANTNPRFDDGNGSSAALLPHPPNPDPMADSDSPPGLWNG